MPEPPHDRFRCEVRPDRDRVIVCPVGELDLATVPDVERELQALRATGFRHLVLDLRGVTFMDSTGLRLLIAEAADAEADGHSLGIVGGSEAVRRLFELTGAAQRLPLVPEREADRG